MAYSAKRDLQKKPTKKINTCDLQKRPTKRDLQLQKTSNGTGRRCIGAAKRLITETRLRVGCDSTFHLQRDLNLTQKRAVYVYIYIAELCRYHRFYGTIDSMVWGGYD